MTQLSLREAAKILSVSPNADVETIKKQFKKLALETHPDKGGNEKEFKKVNAAYARLMYARTNKDKSIAGFTDFEYLFFIEDDILTSESDFAQFVRAAMKDKPR